MSASTNKTSPIAATSGPALGWLVTGGFGFILLAAGLLWWRFGAAIFLDSLSAAWNCI